MPRKPKPTPDPRLAALPRYIIKSGKYFINTHTGDLKHEDSITEWLPKSPIQHEAIMEKRWDLR
ncbi:MAG: hypothetical protein EOO20_07110 [Chryseobacterium sp.]|nr:MAG: hypothetical protein EOO20_07110 [Chryseobacterium sp.]